MASSMFGAKQRISEPLSALAVHTGRYREIKHPRPKIFGAKRVSVLTIVCKPPADLKSTIDKVRIMF